MGRHSAPDGNESEDQSVPAAVALAPSPLGRHSRRDETTDAESGVLAEARTGELAAVTEPVTEPDDKPSPFHRPSGGRPPRPPTRSAWPPRTRPAPERNVAEGVETAAPDDVTTLIPPVEAPLLDQPEPEPLTELIPELEPPADPPAEASAPDAESTDTSGTTTANKTDQKSGSGHATAADLALLRQHGDVRARCLAGLLVPFVAYVVILLAIGSFTTRTVLLWLAVPIVAAGVLVGLFLDLGHRRHGTVG